MKLNKFFELINISSLFSNLIPIIIGTMYCIITFEKFDGVDFFLFSAGLIFLEASIYGISNFVKIRNARKLGYKKTFEDIYEMSDTAGKTSISLILLMMVIFSLLLTINSGFTVFFAMIFLFFLFLRSTYKNIYYRFSISKITLSAFITFLVMFMSIYIHAGSIFFVNMAISDSILILQIYIKELAGIFLLAMPIVLLQISVHLADDLCNSKKRYNKNFSITKTIGERKILIAIGAVQLSAYVFIILLVLFDYVSSVYLISLLSYFGLYSNFKDFSLNRKGRCGVATIQESALMMDAGILIAFIIIGLLHNFQNYTGSPF